MTSADQVDPGAPGGAAALELEGSGPMTWKAEQARWVISVTQPKDPGQVTVCGIEGCASAAVLVQ